MASAEEFIINIRVPTSNVDVATSAIDRLGAALGAQSAFVKDLQSQLGNPSLTGKQFDALAAKVATASAKMRSLQDSLTNAEAKSANAKAKSDERAIQQSENLAKQQAKDAATKLKFNEKLLTQSEKLAANDANDAANESLTGKLKGAVGAMESATGVTGKLTAGLRALGPAGAAVATALTVIIAVVGAVVIAFRDMAAAAISISQEKDALAATFKALSTGSESGTELVDSLSEVAAALPFAEGKVLAWGKSLMSAGIEGDKLTSAVKATAAATALMGDEGGQALQTMVKQLAAGGDAADAMIKTVQAGGKKAAVQLAAMGLQADDLARALGVSPEKMKTMALTAEQLGDAIEKAVTEKGAGALETMGLTWDSIKSKISDGAEDLFEDMGSAVTPFMQEVKSLFSEFFAGSTTMTTTKEIITAALTQVFAVATKVVNFLHKGFLMVEIAAFQVATAMLPIVRIIMAIATNSMVLDGLIFILKTIGVVILAIAAPLMIVTAAFWAVGAVVFAVLSAIVGAILWCVGDAVRAFGVMGTTISTWASSAASAAGNFVMGIVNGISTGAGLVVDAVKNLASSAMSAFTGFFKIKSPSQLMADTAIHIPGGAAVGIEAGTGDVVEAMEDMGDAGMGGASKGFAKQGGTKAGGGGGDVYNLNVQYSGAKEDYEDFETKFLNTVAKLRGMAPRTT